MTQDSVRKDEILLSSTGRPPWYTPTGKAVPSYVIGIAGGSASGKTHVATSILRQLNHIPTCLILSQDSFYNKLNAEKHALAHKNELDLDAPEAIDMKLFAQVGKISIYNTKDKTLTTPAAITVREGLERRKGRQLSRVQLLGTSTAGRDQVSLRCKRHYR
jgi:hypothetical protein